MRLICPHCMSGVTVPDDVAGKEATCPNCGKSFPTPARYSAAVSEPPPPPPAPIPPPVQQSELTVPLAQTPPAPPGLVPPVPPPAPSGFLSHPPAVVPAMVGYTKSIGVTISPHVVAWLPAVLLTAVLLLTFFPWVGCYAGGTAVCSQRPWGAMFGLTPTYNVALEGTVPGGWLDKVRNDWLVFLPFFLLLFVAVAFAWGDRGFSSIDPRKLPPLAKLWPWRNSIVAGCAALILLLLVVQWMNGFAIERAIRKQIAEKFAERHVLAASSREEQIKLEYAEGQEFDRYNVEHTTWMYLALTCSALAVAAVMLRVGLDGRGNKPPPKILFHY